MDTYDKTRFRFTHEQSTSVTATPRNEVHHDTYHLFDLETGIPTDYYGLEEVEWDLYKRHLALVAEHRVTPFDFTVEGGAPPYTKVYIEPDGSYTFDHTHLDRYLRFVLDENHGNTFNVGFTCWFFKVFTPDSWGAFRAIDRATGEEREIRYELFSPRFSGTVEISGDRGRAVRAGQRGVVSLATRHDSVGGFLYRSATGWVQDRVRRAFGRGGGNARK